MGGWVAERRRRRGPAYGWDPFFETHHYGGHVFDLFWGEGWVCGWSVGHGEGFVKSGWEIEAGSGVFSCAVLVEAGEGDTLM